MTKRLPQNEAASFVFAVESEEQLRLATNCRPGIRELVNPGREEVA
jgi:hypothetical protein